MNEAILYPCCSSFKYLRLIQFCVLFGIAFIIGFMIIDTNFDYPLLDIVFFSLLHVPSIFAIVYAYAQTKTWYFEIINSSDNISLSIYLSRYLDFNENEFTIAKRQQIYHRIAKISRNAYLSSLFSVFGMLIAIEHNCAVADDLLFIFWRHLFNLQITFFIWLILRFFVSPLVITTCYSFCIQ